jgi:hypothetical protein
MPSRAIKTSLAKIQGNWAAGVDCGLSSSQLGNFANDANCPILKVLQIAGINTRR